MYQVSLSLSFVCCSQRADNSTTSVVYELILTLPCSASVLSRSDFPEKRSQYATELFLLVNSWEFREKIVRISARKTRRIFLYRKQCRAHPASHKKNNIRIRTWEKER